MKYVLRYGHICSYPLFLGHPVQSKKSLEKYSPMLEVQSVVSWIWYGDCMIYSENVTILIGLIDYSSLQYVFCLFVVFCPVCVLFVCSFKAYWVFVCAGKMWVSTLIFPGVWVGVVCVGMWEGEVMFFFRVCGGGGANGWGGIRWIGQGWRVTTFLSHSNKMSIHCLIGAIWS